MRNTELEETQAGIKIAGRNINNLRYADDTTLMAESEEELKSLLMKVKEESDKVGLKLNIVQETGIKTIPMEKKCKKVKWLPEEALQIAVKRREAKSKGEKEKYEHLNVEFQRIARRDKKPFLSDQCKEIEEKNRMRKTKDHFKKI